MDAKLIVAAITLADAYVNVSIDDRECHFCDYKNEKHGAKCPVGKYMEQIAIAVAIVALTTD